MASNGFIAGAALGAACMFLADPGRGARRRATVRAKMIHARRKTAAGLDASRRDVAHRARGLWAGTRRRWSERGAPDHVLVERARATLGRYVSHPHAVEITAQTGGITLRGKILKHEVRPLVRALRRVPGVLQVDDLLEQYESGTHIPSLQGGRPRPGSALDVTQRHWAPATRTFMGSAGSALFAYGASRRDMAGALLAFAGAGLTLRAATDVEARRLVGVGAGRRAVDIQKAIHIDAPVTTVFKFWSNFENFPHFMRNVREVHTTSSAGQYHWTITGPGRVPIEFDAVITRYVPDQCLAWKTVEGSSVAHTGIVRFESDDAGGTRLQIRVSYNPPGGAIGHALALLLGEDPKTKMDEDLARMKTLLETGNPPRDAAQPINRSPDTVM